MIQFIPHATLFLEGLCHALPLHLRRTRILVRFDTLSLFTSISCVLQKKKTHKN